MTRMWLETRDRSLGRDLRAHAAPAFEVGYGGMPKGVGSGKTARIYWTGWDALDISLLGRGGQMCAEKRHDIY